MRMDVFDNMLRRYDFRDDGTIVVESIQDVEPILKNNKALRDNEDEHLRKKSDWVKYASVPMVIVEDLMKKGINLFDENDIKRAIKVIERDYPYLKTTNLKEA
jgi:hypothetical protein